MQNDIERVLLSEEQIQNRVREIGAQIAEEYRDKNPVMICILKGSTMSVYSWYRRFRRRLNSRYFSC